jgi:dCMP deaminase
MVMSNAPKWDKFFHNVCKTISKQSTCLSRQIGAILVKDKSIVATGYNGPARGYPHCHGTCRRKEMGFKSGEGLVHCPAAHAEGNCVANAARIGATTVGTTLYLNCLVPCKDCMILLVNAGVVEVVVEDNELYHDMSQQVALHGNIVIRRFVYESNGSR